MKKTIKLTLIFMVVLFTTVATIRGMVKYEDAKQACKELVECSDLNIVLTLKSYDFNLDWFEHPTVIDYFVSGLTF